jgi:AcrR family transcriptional regulator
MTNDENAFSGVLPAHQSRSRDQRDRLLKAGERVFAEKGFWQAHVSDIAQAADCSVGSFYRRFKDKEGLFFALQEYMQAHAQDNIRRFFDDPACVTDPYHDLFFRLSANTLRTVRGIAGYYRALYEMSLRGHPVWPKMRQLEAYQGARIAQLVAARGGRSSRDDLVTAGQFITRTVNGQINSVVLYGAGPFGVEDRRLPEELANLYVEYLGLEDSP